MLSQLLSPPHQPLPDFSASEKLLKISPCLSRDVEYRLLGAHLGPSGLHSFGYSLMPSSIRTYGICLMYTTPLDHWSATNYFIVQK